MEIIGVELGRKDVRQGGHVALGGGRFQLQGSTDRATPECYNRGVW